MGKIGRFLTALFIVLLPSLALALDYPERPITIVVPFSAGGPTDTVTRLVAEAMSKDLGQQVVVENVGGAGGTLGAGRVAKAAPDGYTLLLHHIGMATSATLYRKLAYDPLEAFEYIGLVTEVPMTIVGAQGSRPRRPQEPDRLRQGQQGQGHLCQCRHRRGVAPLRHAVHEHDRHAADHRSLQGHRPGDDRPDRRPGRLHVRPDHQHDQPDQVAARSRPMPRPAASGSTVLPDVPTAKEQGLDIEVGVWHGLYAPKGTPKAIIDRLAAVAAEGASGRRR